MLLLLLIIKFLKHSVCNTEDNLLSAAVTVAAEKLLLAVSSMHHQDLLGCYLFWRTG